MSNARAIAVVISADASNFRTTLYRAALEADQFGTKVGGAGNRASKAMTMIGAAAKVGLLALTLALGLAVASAVKFEATMQNVATNTNASQAQIRSLSQSVLDMSKVLPQDANDLAEGLYFITSSAFEGAGALKVLDASARSASAGLATTEESSQAIVSVLNAYGLGAEDAAWAGDVLFNSVKLGVMKFSDLTHVVGRYIATAAALKVPFEDVQSALSTMTLQGLSAAESSTALNGVFRTLLKPGVALTKMMKDLGISTKDLSDPSIGLHGVMEQIRVATGGNVEQMRALFPEIRANRGAMLLINNEGRTYTRVFDSMKNSTGAVGDALKIQMEGFGMQIKVVMNQIKAMGIELGLILIPVLRSMFEGAVEGAKDLWGIIKQLGEAMRPTGKALMRLGEDGAAAFATVLDTLKPLIAILVGGFIKAINVGSTALAGMVGWLAKNEGVVRTLTVAFVAFAAVKAFNALISGAETLYLTMLYVQDAIVGSSIATMFSQVIAGARMAAAGMMTMGTNAVAGFGMIRQGAGTIVSALATPQVAIAGLAIGLMVWMQGVSKAHAQAAAQIKDLGEGLDSKSIGSLKAYQKRLDEAQNSAQKAADKTSGLAGGLKFLYEMATPATNSVLDARVAADDLGIASEEAAAKVAKLYDKYSAIGKLVFKDPGSSMNATEVEKYIKVLNSMDFDTGTMTNKEIADAINEVQDRAILGVPAVEDYAGAMSTLADDTSSAADQVGALKDAFDALIGAPLAVFDATTKMDEAMRDLTKTALESGASLDTTAEGGDAFRNSLSGSIQAALDLANAIGQTEGPDKATASLQKSAKAIGELAVKLGLTQPEVDALWQSFNIDPESLKYNFEVDGVDDAETKVDAFKNSTKDKITAKASLDAGDFDTVMINLMVQMATYAGENPKAFAFLNIDDPTLKGAELQAAMERYVLANPTAQAYLDTLNPEQRAVFLAQLAEQWRKSNPSTRAKLDTGEAERQLAAFMARDRVIRIRAMIDSKVAPGLINAEKQGRWGMIDHSYARGGISQAHVQKRQRIKYAEPQTGGEGYVPRLGDPKRSKGVMDTIAGWYGWQVIDPKKVNAQNYGLTSQPLSRVGGGFGGGRGAGGLMINVAINAPIYGVDQLEKAMSDAAVQAFGKEYDKVVTKIQTREDARR